MTTRDDVKTTRDAIQIDLNGSIDDAIAKLQELKNQYPDGELDFTTETEYGDTYERLYLRFRRDKTPVELEYDKWRFKLDRYSQLCRAARTYEAEGDPYPRADELAKLKDELGYWAKMGRMGMLTIFDGQVLMQDMMRGAVTRDGVWVLKAFGFERYEEMMKAMDE